MKRLSFISLLLIVVTLLCNKSFAVETDQFTIGNISTDTVFQNSVNNSIVSSLDSINHKIFGIQDSILNVNAKIQSYYFNLENKQTDFLEKQEIINKLLLGLVIGILVICLFLGYFLFQIKRKQLTAIIDEKTLTRSIEPLRDNLTNMQNVISEASNQNKVSVEEYKIVLLDSLKDCKRTSESISVDLQDIRKKLFEIVKEKKSKEPVVIPQTSFNQVSYDAAVDAWIHINNHLAHMGKNRKSIQHVYALLAGHHVEQKDLQNDLLLLDEERREEVNTIISDINRFKSQHLQALEECGSIKAGSTISLKEMVRFPLGEPFDNDMDEELTGDPVENGKQITMVASLGYRFPGSLNGHYQVKSKVKVIC